MLLILTGPETGQVGELEDSLSKTDKTSPQMQRNLDYSKINVTLKKLKIYIYIFLNWN